MGLYQLYHIIKSPCSVCVQGAGWCSYCTQVIVDTLTQGHFTSVVLIELELWHSTVHSEVARYYSQKHWPKYQQICYVHTTLSSCPEVIPYDVYRWTHTTWENILLGIIKVGLSDVLLLSLALLRFNRGLLIQGLPCVYMSCKACSCMCKRIEIQETKNMRLWWSHMKSLCFLFYFDDRIVYICPHPQYRVSYVTNCYVTLRKSTETWTN